MIVMQFTSNSVGSIAHPTIPTSSYQAKTSRKPAPKNNDLPKNGCEAKPNSKYSDRSDSFSYASGRVPSMLINYVFDGGTCNTSSGSGLKFRDISNLENVFWGITIIT